MAHVSPNLETFQKADEIMQIFRSAVRKAQAESRRLGVPNVYTINGQRYFEFPNGEYRKQGFDSSGEAGA